MAREYAAQGARLALVGRRTEALANLRDSLANPQWHQIYAVDVNDQEALTQAALLVAYSRQSLPPPTKSEGKPEH